MKKPRKAVKDQADTLRRMMSVMIPTLPFTAGEDHENFGETVRNQESLPETLVDLDTGRFTEEPGAKT
jgi:hypothetical protein